MTCAFFRWAIHGGWPALSTTEQQRSLLHRHLDECPHCEEYLETMPDLTQPSVAAALGVSQEEIKKALELGRADAERENP